VFWSFGLLARRTCRNEHWSSHSESHSDVVFHCSAKIYLRNCVSNLPARNCLCNYVRSYTCSAVPLLSNIQETYRRSSDSEKFKPYPLNAPGPRFSSGQDVDWPIYSTIAGCIQASESETKDSVMNHVHPWCGIKLASYIWRCHILGHMWYFQRYYAGRR
jgi:hypothetical protein